MQAKTDYPVHELIARRWSPYSFDRRPVSVDDLHAIFEAARWAPSSFNEQPWRFLLATRNDAGAFSTMLSCLTEGNRTWGQHAPVLALGVTKRSFTRNGKPNRAALHDLGLASANLSLEATARGLSVHQMIGIEPDRARQIYQVPDDFDVYTGLAIGYPADPTERLSEFADRDQTRRPRKPLREMLFEGTWNIPAASL